MYYIIFFILGVILSLAILSISQCLTSIILSLFEKMFSKNKKHKNKIQIGFDINNLT
jgi:hypothetical protein